eukprot:UN20898
MQTQEEPRQSIRMTRADITIKTRLTPPFPKDTEMITLAMGCFWCSENLYNSFGWYLFYSRWL